MNDKIIVTNLAALKTKYGATGVKKIRAAVTALIAADKARGFHTRLLALDRATDMKKVKGPRVTDRANPRQNKTAIDAIYTAIRPDYLLILGAIDVVPHQDLINPVFGKDDEDQYAYGDIPYACEQPYSQQAEKFIGPTRVAGRLPDLTAGNDPAYLLGLLDTAAKWKSRTREDYSDYFAVSADQWKKSTTLSLVCRSSSDRTKISVWRPREGRSGATPSSLAGLISLIATGGKLTPNSMDRRERSIRSRIMPP